MSEIKAGDVVQLKSGGVRMTVAWVEGDRVLCQWQDRATAMEKAYSPVVLKAIEAPAQAGVFTI